MQKKRADKDLPVPNKSADEDFFSNFVCYSESPNFKLERRKCYRTVINIAQNLNTGV